VSVAHEGPNSDPQLGDGAFQFRTLSRGDQCTQLANALVGGDDRHDLSMAERERKCCTAIRVGGLQFLPGHEGEKWRGAVVIYCAFDGSTFLFPARVGVLATGSGDCAFYSPEAGHLLDFYHLVFGVDWGRGLHCRGDDSGCGVAARVVSGISPAAADS